MKVFSFCQKINLLIIFFSCLILLWVVSYGAAETPTLDLDIKDSIIEIKAINVPLGDILKAISERAEISFKLDDSLAEPFSIGFKGPIEECIQRLLGQRSYVMIYDDKGDGRQVLAEVFLVSAGNVVRFDGRSNPPGDPIGGNAKNWFKREFGEGRPLSHMVSATPSNGGFDRTGIKITKLSGNSPFHKIGLEEGDIIVDVNGQSVSTIEDFIQALQSFSKEQLGIRIDRRRDNNIIDPIYIDLH